MFMLSEMLEDFMSRNMELTPSEKIDLDRYQAEIRIAGQEKTFWADLFTKEYFTDDQNTYKKLLLARVAESRRVYEATLKSFTDFLTSCIKNHTAK